MFPFDQQKCNFIVGTFSHNSSEVLFTKEHARHTLHYIQSERIEGYQISAETVNQEDLIWTDIDTDETFSLSGISIVLINRSVKWILVYYIPTGNLYQAVN